MGAAGTQQVGKGLLTTVLPFFLHQAGDPQTTVSPAGWPRPLTDISPRASVSAKHQQGLPYGPRYRQLHVLWAIGGPFCALRGLRGCLLGVWTSQS